MVGRLRLSESNFQQFATTGAPRDIVAGPDGNLWFTKGSGAIGRITPAGTLLPDFTAGISPGANPNSIALGPDGNVWFTEAAGIGRITPAGTVTEFSLAPNDDPSSKITAGPDGNLWFTQFNDDRVGRITPDGVITLFTQGITANGSPSGITTGPDGRIWFTQYNGHRLGVVTLEPPTAVTGGATSIRPELGERDRHREPARLSHDGQVRLRALGGVREFVGTGGAGSRQQRRCRARRAHRTDAAVDRPLPRGGH